MAVGREPLEWYLDRTPDLQLEDQFWDHLAVRLARWRGCSAVLTLLDQGEQLELVS